MHLRTPILSAAIAMGLGGITTVHQVSLSAIYLDGEVRCHLSCLGFVGSLRYVVYFCGAHHELLFLSCQSSLPFVLPITVF